MSRARRKKIPVCFYLDPEQDAALRKLSKATGAPASLYLRRGVEWVLSVANGLSSIRADRRRAR